MKTPAKCKTCLNLLSKTDGKKHCCWLGIWNKPIQDCHSHCKNLGYKGYRTNET